MDRVIDDVEWDEVEKINSYALFMGYLSMAVKGLSYLVFTWTTVVLLGGFVSGLRKKDFWCLTLITLVQTVGVFNVSLNEKLSYIPYSVYGLAVVLGTMVVEDITARAAGGRKKYVQSMRPKPSSPGRSKVLRIVLPAVLVLGLVLALVLGLVLGLVVLVLGLVVLVLELVLMLAVMCGLFPLAILYWCGLLITSGISLWRLIERDYGDGGAANLEPALVVLYSLALFQGVLFCYRSVSSLARWRLASDVAECYKFGDSGRALVEDYLDETRIGCEKNPSFAKGRNLVTYAVELMESRSPDSYRSGVKILDVLIRRHESRMLDSDIMRHMLIKHLVRSASSSHILLRLLQMLDSRGPHDREMRVSAARIMAYLAGEIHLEQFPRGIQCISSLLDTFEEYRLEPYQRDWHFEISGPNWHPEPFEREDDDSDAFRKGYKDLVLQGLRILWKLAANEDNCRVMSNTEGLLPKIMAPVASDLLHSIQDHGAWSSIVEGSLRVTGQLVTAGKTGAKLRHEISTNKDAISTMESILRCDECGEEPAELHKQAMGILTQLYMDEKNSSMSTESRENFIEMLLDILTHDNKDSSIRNLAGEALAMLSSEGGSNATIILLVNGDAVGSLTEVLVHVKKKKYRISAAQILEHLCSHYTKDDECLKKAMVDAMLKVLGEILCCGLTGEEIHRGKEAYLVGSSAPEFDIENPHDNSRDDGWGNRYSSHQQNDEQDEEEFEAALLSALLSLCVTVCDTFISAEQDLALHFNAINTFSFPRKLKEMVQRNSDPSDPTANCLRTMKLTTKMVISMMKHRGSYMQQDLESLMELLSNNSETMSDLDFSMIFASGDHGATTTLASLVKEAQALVDQKKAQELAIEFV